MASSAPSRKDTTSSGLTHECGVFGAIATKDWSNVDIAQIICMGLEALQHRGQESCGIVTNDERSFHIQKGMGLVRSVFNNENMTKLKGHMGVGHTRYSTSAKSEEVNCQPFVVHSMHGSLAVAHNGELVNWTSLRRMVFERGVGLSTHSDSELITQALCLTPPDGEVDGPDWPARIRHLMQLAPLSYSIVLMLSDKIYAVRDPYGNRPLCLGRIISTSDDSSKGYSQGEFNCNGEATGCNGKATDCNGEATGCNGKATDCNGKATNCNGKATNCNGKATNCNRKAANCNGEATDCNGESTGDSKGEGWVVASESCAFLSISRYVREVMPGEIIELSAKGVRTIDIVARPEGKKEAFCIFEYVYFARPNSIFEGQEVYTVRAQCGAQLAIDYPVEADVVGSVPESGNAAAFGYSKQANVPMMELLTKNSYVGRTFIQPTTRLRQLNVALKFSPISVNVSGKRIVLIDDSIVRGNTIGQIIRLLRKSGAKEVHIRVASPPLRHPCYMGINIPTREELIANAMDSEKLAKEVGADSLEYLTVPGLVKAVQRNILGTNPNMGHCTACLTGEYPGGVPSDFEW